MKLDIMEIVKRSWEITWKYKYLWLLGFLASLTSCGSSYSYNSPNQSSENSQAAEAVYKNVFDYLSTHILVIVIALFALFLIWLVLIVVSEIGKGGLVFAVSKIDRNESNSLKTAFQTGVRYFWRVLGMDLILGLISVGVFAVWLVISVVPIAVLSNTGLSDGAPLYSLCCLIPLDLILLLLMVAFFILIAAAQNYALRFIVIEGANVIDAMRRGYDMFKHCWVDTLVMYITLGFIGFLLILPIVLLVLIAIGIIFLGGLMSATWLTVIGTIILVLVMIAGIIYGAAVSTFGWVGWTITYLRITAPTAPTLDKP